MVVLVSIITFFVIITRTIQKYLIFSLAVFSLFDVLDNGKVWRVLQKTGNIFTLI